MSHYHGEREKDLYDMKIKEQVEKNRCDKDKRIEELEAQLIEVKKELQFMTSLYTDY